MGNLIIYQGPWDWGFLWNRAQPLASALSKTSSVIYLNHGVEPVSGAFGRILRFGGKMPKRFRARFASLNRNYQVRKSASLSIWVWEGSKANPWLLTGSDRPSDQYAKLGRLIRKRASDHSSVWLLTSRPQAEGLWDLYPWNKRLVDIEDPWFDLSWGSTDRRQVLMSGLSKADAVFANGPKIATEYARISGRQIHSLPNGVDAGFINALAQDLGCPEFMEPRNGMIRAVFTGNINDRIDFGALEQITTAPGFSFYFIGQDSVPEQHKVCWERIKSKQNVRWISPRPHSEVPSILQHSDVLLLPYFCTGHDKMFPAKLFEYTAACKPIVSTMDFSDGTIRIPSMDIAERQQDFLVALEGIRSRRAQLGGETIERCRLMARDNTWDSRATELIQKANEASGYSNL
jgi:glycosyltransferase involved in cell wall biosynthesis